VFENNAMLDESMNSYSSDDHIADCLISFVVEISLEKVHSFAMSVHKRPLIAVINLPAHVVCIPKTCPLVRCVVHLTWLKVSPLSNNSDLIGHQAVRIWPYCSTVIVDEDGVH
jgi:hypothetical protein